MVVLHIAFCALCTHISMFVFICSLIIILCVLKTVQPTPLVVEPGRYSWYNVEFTLESRSGSGWYNVELALESRWCCGWYIVEFALERW